MAGFGLGKGCGSNMFLLLFLLMFNDGGGYCEGKEGFADNNLFFLLMLMMLFGGMGSY